MKKKMVIVFITAIAVALLLPLQAFASNKADRAVEIVNTLESYNVSADWPPDLKSNSLLLDELKALVEGFDANDALSLGVNKDKVIKYYTKYCEAMGENAALPSSFDIHEASAAREKVLKILVSLVNGQVNPAVPEDIKANADKIESMLVLLYDYTPDDCEQTPLAERESIEGYLTGFYKYKGWDVSELDLLFSASEYPEQTAAPVPQKPVTAPVPKMPSNVQGTQQQSSTTENQQDSVSVITALITAFIWLALLVCMVFILKKRNEKH